MNLLKLKLVPLLSSVSDSALVKLKLKLVPLLSSVSHSALVKVVRVPVSISWLHTHSLHV